MACRRLLHELSLFFVPFLTVAGELWAIVSSFRLSSSARTRRFGFKSGVRFTLFLQLIKKVMSSTKILRHLWSSQETIFFQNIVSTPRLELYVLDGREERQTSCKGQNKRKAAGFCIQRRRQREGVEEILWIYLCWRSLMKPPEMRVVASDLREIPVWEYRKLVRNYLMSCVNPSVHCRIARTVPQALTGVHYTKWITTINWETELVEAIFSQKI